MDGQNRRAIFPRAITLRLMEVERSIKADSRVVAEVLSDVVCLRLATTQGRHDEEKSPDGT